MGDLPGLGEETGVFADEIAPIEIKSKKGVKEFKAEEHPRPETKIKGLAKLPTVFKKGGVVTAGSASGICYGAAAVIIASEEAVAKHNLTPIARILGLIEQSILNSVYKRLRPWAPQTTTSASSGMTSSRTSPVSSAT